MRALILRLKGVGSGWGVGGGWYSIVGKRGGAVLYCWLRREYTFTLLYFVLD